MKDISSRQKNPVKQVTRKKIQHRKVHHISIKKSSILTYGLLFVALVSLVGYGYGANATISSNKKDMAVANVQDTEPNKNKASSIASDAIATQLGSEIATAANLSVAPNVSNLAISAQITEEMPVASLSDTAAPEAPQAVSAPVEQRSVTEHVVEADDTVTSLASHYGITPETIKWANNLTDDALEEGKVLKILPTSGVSYTVKPGDTVASIAEKYKVSEDRLVLYNDLELTGIQEGESIILPSAELPEEERPGYVPPSPRVQARTSTSNNRGSVTTRAFRGGSVGNKYARGWCTWYAYERRAQAGRPVGSFWGNANTWAGAARSNGYLVNNSPAAGAIFQTTGGSRYGHVGYIESVDYANGTVTYSDMNGLAGWNRVGTATTTIADAQKRWTFIH